MLSYLIDKVLSNIGHRMLARLANSEQTIYLNVFNIIDLLC